MCFVSALGYIAFAVSDAEQWRSFATDVLGTVVETKQSGEMDLRIDDYAWRVRLHPSDSDKLFRSECRLCHTSAKILLQHEPFRGAAAYSITGRG